MPNYFWIDLKDEMIGIFMTQIRPYHHLKTGANSKFS